jgi:hypothetical protein
MTTSPESGYYCFSLELPEGTLRTACYGKKRPLNERATTTLYSIHGSDTPFFMMLNRRAATALSARRYPSKTGKLRSSYPPHPFGDTSAIVERAFSGGLSLPMKTNLTALDVKY